MRDTSTLQSSPTTAGPQYLKVLGTLHIYGGTRGRAPIISTTPEWPLAGTRRTR